VNPETKDVNSKPGAKTAATPRHSWDGVQEKREDCKGQGKKGGELVKKEKGDPQGKFNFK